MFKKLKSNNRWNAVCDESRMHGVERGKRWRLYQNLTYRYSIMLASITKTISLPKLLEHGLQRQSLKQTATGQLITSQN